MAEDNYTERFRMAAHVEGGRFCELYTEEKKEHARAASGVIYYALEGGEHAQFHCLDCDEYWLYHAGDAIEIWIYLPDGQRRVERLGMDEDAQPCVLLKAGWVFGARAPRDGKKTTLLSCVTVPAFTYENYRLFTKKEMLSRYPDVKEFYA